MRTVVRWFAFAAVVLVVACAPGGPPTVTDLYVHPATGDDGDPGTAAAPLRTLSAALALAEDGMTVHLAAGTYDAANGETWPTQVGFPPVATPNVPDGVSIVGATGVRLVGPGGATTAAALAFAGEASVSDVEVEGFERAILAWLPGPVTLTRVRATGNSIDGLLAFGAAEVLAVLSRFDANGLSGAAAFGDAVLDLQGGEVDGNRTGVYATDDATVSVLDTLIHDNGSTSDASHSGVFAIGTSRVNLSGVVLDGNSLAGVELRGDASVAVTDGTISGGGLGVFVFDATSGASLRVYDSDVSATSHGIWWVSSGGGELFVRGTTVRLSSGVGIAVYGEPAVVDLGAPGAASGNRFDQNGAPQLYDGRPGRAAADGPVITVDVDAIHPGVPCLMAIDTYVGPYVYICNGVTAFEIGGANQRLRVVSD